MTPVVIPNSIKDSDEESLIEAIGFVQNNGFKIEKVSKETKTIYVKLHQLSDSEYDSTLIQDEIFRIKSVKVPLVEIENSIKFHADLFHKLSPKLSIPTGISDYVKVVAIEEVYYRKHNSIREAAIEILKYI